VVTQGPAGQIAGDEIVKNRGCRDKSGVQLLRIGNVLKFVAAAVLYILRSRFGPVVPDGSDQVTRCAATRATPRNIKNLDTIKIWRRFFSAEFPRQKPYPCFETPLICKPARNPYQTPLRSVGQWIVDLKVAFGRKTDPWGQSLFALTAADGNP
jgi:hypothetical protein